MVELAEQECHAEGLEALRAQGVNSVCLFRRNLKDVDQIRALTQSVRAVLGDQALIAIDHEGGAVVRTRGILPTPPSAMSLGAANDESLTKSIGTACGRQLKALGINWTFAPVLDLASNPDNPIIADRAFSDEPQRAAAHALAWAAGCMSAGVAACGKHFPGHGDTEQDSHLAQATVNLPVETLMARELASFREACLHPSDPLPALMTAHVKFPALDPEHPATLSRRMLTTLLREEWGYEGVVVTDAMDMKAVADRYGRDIAAGLAARAGADLIMALGDTTARSQTLHAIAVEVSANDKARAQHLASIKRLDALATRFAVNSSIAASNLATQAISADQLAADQSDFVAAWRRGLTAFGTPRIPPKGSRIRLVYSDVTCGNAISEPGLDADAFLKALGDRYTVEPIRYDPTHPASLPNVPTDDPKTPVILVTSHRHRPLAATEAWMQSLASKLSANAANKTTNTNNATPEHLHLALWNPYAVPHINLPAVLTYGPAREATEALFDWFDHGGELTGRAPKLV